MRLKGDKGPGKGRHRAGPSRLSLARADVRLAWFAATRREQGGSGQGEHEAVFRTIFAENHWHNAESRSGPGSTDASTARFRDKIPKLLRKLGAASFLDAPCGDFNWMRHVDLGPVRYIGADVVPEVVAANRERFAARNRTFLHLDISRDRLPRVDVIFCRDCLVHMSYADIALTFANFRRSGSAYLLTTTFTRNRENRDIKAGGWRPLDLQRAPFNLPAPQKLIVEHCPEGGGAYRDKSLALWRIGDLPS